MWVLFVILIALALLMIVVLLQLFRAVRLPDQSIIAFTGTLGSGKTYLGVKYAIKAYRKQYAKHKIYMLLSIFPFVGRIMGSWKYPASLYSNIPIRVRKNEYSQPLKREHLLERGLLPEKCVVFIDEIGAIASQWEFDNPLVLEQLEKLIRFFRHWLDGKMFVTDQVVTNIVKPIRSRLGMIYNLHDFRRWGAFTPFYKVLAVPLMLIDDNSVNAVQSTAEFEDSYFFGYLGYSRNIKKRSYNTRCYKPIYQSCAVKDIVSFDDPSLYTRYLIDISVSKTLSREYQRDKERFKNYLYQDISVKSEEISEVNPMDILDT